LLDDFDCGDEPWGIEAAQWIKSDSVLSMTQDGCEVWLYYTDTDGAVAFGSLARTHWAWSKPSSKRIPISVIPWLAIQRKFFGRPVEVSRNDRYGRQLLRDLLAEVSTRGDRLPLMGLCVDPRNHRAIAVYEEEGFNRFGKDYIDPSTDIGYIRMLKRLT